MSGKMNFKLFEAAAGSPVVKSKEKVSKPKKGNNFAKAMMKKKGKTY